MYSPLLQSVINHICGKEISADCIISETAKQIGEINASLHKLKSTLKLLRTTLETCIWDIIENEYKKCGRDVRQTLTTPIHTDITQENNDVVIRKNAVITHIYIPSKIHTELCRIYVDEGDTLFYNGNGMERPYYSIYQLDIVALLKLYEQLKLLCGQQTLFNILNNLNYDQPDPTAP